MQNNTAEQESKGQPISWEVIGEGERGELLAESIEQIVIQKLAAAAGYMELTVSDNPKHTPQSNESANLAKEVVLTANMQLQAIQRVLRQDPNQPLPVDRTTYPGRPFIALDQVLSAKS